MNITLTDNGTYFCSECKFVFGKEFVEGMGDTFENYHENLHKIVMA